MSSTRGGGGNAGKKVNGKWETAARKSSRCVPYQEWMESKVSSAGTRAFSRIPNQSNPVSASARVLSANRINGSTGRGAHTSV
ncbi:MAG: hypothetical protein ABI824_04325 [Acidobacteriota bacterium]